MRVCSAVQRSRAPASARAKAVGSAGAAGRSIRTPARLGDVVATRRADTLEAAVQTAASLAQPGDAVVLSPACSSFDMFRDYKHRGDEFVRCVRALEKEDAS